MKAQPCVTIRCVKHTQDGERERESMLPSLHCLDSAEIGYEASQTCPDPPGAGDLRNGVELTPGNSAVIYRAADGKSPVDGVFKTKYAAEETEQDWKLGTVALKEDAMFIHVATSRLPKNLVKGEVLRTDRRVYAHTDTKNWVWKGADRVYIEWPAGLPFQIMRTLRGADMYQRSCRYLQTDNAVTITPNEDGKIDWPFANVATVIPSALFSVVETPTPVKSPIEFALLRPKFKELGMSATTNPDSLNDETIFASNSEENIKALKMAFENETGPFQQYSVKMETDIGDGGRKRKKAFLVAVAIEDSNVAYKLTVNRTCMYTALLLRARSIDMSAYVASENWDPRKYTFQAPYRNNPVFQTPPPVTVDERFQERLYVQTFISAYNSTPLNIQIALWRLNPQAPIVSMSETEYISWFESSSTPPSDSIMPSVIKMYKDRTLGKYDELIVCVQRLFTYGKIVVNANSVKEVSKFLVETVFDDADMAKELLRSMKTYLTSDGSLLEDVVTRFDNEGNPEEILQFLIDDLRLELTEELSSKLLNYE